MRLLLLLSLARAIRRFEQALPATALASYPGSGNTWARALLEAATGILTGSAYVDAALVHAGFLGEGATERVLAIKTHWPWDDDAGLANATLDGLGGAAGFDRALVLVRHPYSAIPSLFAYQHTRAHGDEAPEHAWRATARRLPPSPMGSTPATRSPSWSARTAPVP